MPAIEFTLAAVDATAGTAVDTIALQPWKSIQFVGVTGGGSYLLQGSNDNADWDNIGSAITSDQTVNIVQPVAFMRVYTTTYKAGAKAVLVAHGFAEV